MQVYSGFCIGIGGIVKGYHLDNSDLNRRVIGLLDSTEGAL